LAGAVALFSAFGADAAPTLADCLAKKRLAWSALRKCQATEDTKRLKGKPADFTKCEGKFQEKLAKIRDGALEAGIACVYGSNGDGTVTDYDTGLMWEQKEGVPCFFSPSEVSHCVTALFNWEPAFAYVAGSSGDDYVVTPPFLAGHSDWRLPTIAELRGIFYTGAPGCGSGSPCIDPAFGASAGIYWSSTRPADSSTAAWCLNFRDGSVGRCAIVGVFPVRAVRSGL
jgi:hypothetical protein